MIRHALACGLFNLNLFFFSRSSQSVIIFLHLPHIHRLRHSFSPNHHAFLTSYVTLPYINPPRMTLHTLSRSENNLLTKIMNPRPSTFFWLTTFAILILSIIVSFYSSSSSTSAIYMFGLETYDRIVDKVVPEEFLFVVQRKHHSHHHHHHHHKHHRKRPKTTCTEWKSSLISSYNISRVLTVDLKGCGNFSSIQKAVDAVPNLSRTKTLIIIDVGTYRFVVNRVYAEHHFFFFFLLEM